MKKIFLIFVVCIKFMSLDAQTNNPPAPGNKQENLLWEVLQKKYVANYGSYEEISLNKNEIQKIYNSDINQLIIPFTTSSGQVMYAIVTLRENKMIRIKTNNSSIVSNIYHPKVFKGKVKSVAYTNNVTVTLSPGYLTMSIYLEKSEIHIGENPLQKNGKFILQRSDEVLQKVAPWKCMMPDKIENTFPSVIPNSKKANTVLSSGDKCTYVFVDCSYAFFISRRSSIQDVVNYVYAVWNDLQTLYENEQMNVKISEINMWTTADPFSTSSSSEVANRSFADHYQNNFWGNMAVLLDWSSVNGGIAGGYGWAKGLAPNVCGTYNPSPNPSWNFGSYAYCNLSGGGTFQNFPVADMDWQVEVCTHELGHLFSSWHTQSCSWPGGPIDNCVAKEGTCTEIGATPTNGGTIMSYCHLTAIGINFNNGFGMLPGDQIRSWITANVCITDCVSCSLFENVGTITQPGFYHFEAFAEITANGSVPVSNTLIKLDASQKVRLLPGFKAGAGSKVQVYIDGCGGIR